MQSNLELPQMVPRGREGTMRGCQAGGGEEGRTFWIFYLCQRRTRKQVQVFNVPLDQDSEYLSDGKSCPSSQGQAKDSCHYS